MTNILNQIRAIVDDFLAENKDLFLVDIIKKGNNISSKMIVLLDGDRGVSISQCAKVSRRVSHYIDEKIGLDIPLMLEVSSVGLDYPLASNRQYVKNISKKVRVMMTNQTILEGKLIAVNEQSIEIAILIKSKKKQTESKIIDFVEINKTIVLVSFK